MEPWNPSARSVSVARHPASDAPTTMTESIMSSLPATRPALVLPSSPGAPSVAEHGHPLLRSARAEDVVPAPGLPHALKGVLRIEVAGEEDGVVGYPGEPRVQGLVHR